MLAPPPANLPITDQTGRLTREWSQWITELQKYAASTHGGDTTAMRPVNGVKTSDMYFDTTLNRPLWWNGTVWVNAIYAADSVNSTVSVTSADASAVTGTSTTGGEGFASVAEFNAAITAIGTIRTLANEIKADVNTLISDTNDLKTKLRTAGILA